MGASADVRPLLRRDVVTIARGVHLLGRTAPNAAYAVETSEGIVLVDTCPQPSAEPVLRQIHDLGLDVRDLRAILLTHAHGDHVLGANRLRELSGAKVHAGRGDVEVLTAGTSRDAFFSVFDLRQETARIEVDVALDEGDAVSVGDTRFVVLATPGHTPGSVCYRLVRDGETFLFTGDVVMSLTNSQPLRGVGTYAAFLPPRFRGDPDAFAATLRRLAGSPVPDVVLPGHPSADPVPQDPRIAPETWRALLREALARLEVLRARHAADGADFLDGTPKEVLPGLRYWGDVDGCAVYAFTTASQRTFVVNAPGGADFAGFVTARLAEAGAAPPTAVLVTSTAPQALSGLHALVAATRCTVVAPAEGFDVVARACPEGTAILDAASLASAGWFPVEVVPVRGLPFAGTAYLLPWAGRTVAFTGALPLRTRLDWGLGVFPPLPSEGVALDPCLATLEALRRYEADVWLPALPMCGQNAHVYDGDWVRTLDANAAALR